MWNGCRGVAKKQVKLCSKTHFLRCATTDGVRGLKAVEPLASYAWIKAMEMAGEMNGKSLVDEDSKIIVPAVKELVRARFNETKEVESAQPQAPFRSGGKKVSKSRGNQKRTHDHNTCNCRQQAKRLCPVEELFLRVDELDDAFTAFRCFADRLTHTMLQDVQMADLEHDSENEPFLSN
jgi:hypothetical protein